MTAQKAAEAPAMKPIVRSLAKPAVSPHIVEPENLFQRMNEAHQAIARRAYELFETRGRGEGHELEDWVQAESELFDPVPVEISDQEDHILVRAEVRGFTGREIEVGVEPRRLVISGKLQSVEGSQTETTSMTEGGSREIFRVVDLPDDVDPANASATLSRGALAVRMPKISARGTTGWRANS